MHEQSNARTFTQGSLYDSAQYEFTQPDPQVEVQSDPTWHPNFLSFEIDDLFGAVQALANRIARIETMAI